VKFTSNPTRTVGVEVELQLVDLETCALSNSVSKILDNVPPHWSDAIKPELMQSYLEINSCVCDSIDEARADIQAKYNWVQDEALRHGIALLWAGTHPFSAWYEQKITPGDRYQDLVDLMQHVARRLGTFGVHVHVGVESGDKAVMICDRMLRHLPSLLALSANSPFWGGVNTGLRSQRIKLMDALPTAGLPQVMRNWSEYVWLIKHLTNTGFINSIREVWWDVRPHHNFGTVEVRIMDTPRSMDHLFGLAALVQCLVAEISDQIEDGAYLTDCHPMLAGQNKWRACRFGLDAGFVDPDTMTLRPAREVIRNLVDLLRDRAQDLGCVDHLDVVYDILDGQNGADHQLALYHAHNSPREVARQLVQCPAATV